MVEEDDAVVEDEEEGGGGDRARGDVIVWKQQQRSHHSRSNLLIQGVSERLISGDLQTKIQAARDIRKAVRDSASSSSSPSSSLKTRSRFAAAGVVQPLVLMLFSPNDEAREASLLALLNLAARNERNKIKIVADGAVPPLVELLKIHNGSLRELATAAILTLSTATPNKPTILASGAAPLLVQILGSGSVQGRVDAVTALHNLFTCKESATACLDAAAVPALINLLKECRKHSKFAEKASALLEILSKSDEGRTAIASSNGGILTLVETIEDGSPISMEHAVGALLTLCQSCRSKYRLLILNEGAIPGLLKLTVEGTPEAQERSRTLLDLLRESPQDKRMASSVLEKIVYDIATRVDGADKAPETAKKLLQDMVQRSIEIKTSRIVPKGASCTTEASSEDVLNSSNILHSSSPNNPIRLFLFSSSSSFRWTMISGTGHSIHCTVPPHLHCLRRLSCRYRTLRVPQGDGSATCLCCPSLPHHLTAHPPPTSSC